MDKHKMIIQTVSCDDWEAIYINNKKIDEGHNINPYLLFKYIKNYIAEVTYITDLDFLSYSMSGEQDLPELFSDINEEEFI